MFIYLDTETTGIGPDDRLCQLAFKTGQGAIINELFHPGKPIAIEAMAVHHITKAQRIGFGPQQLILEIYNFLFSQSQLI